MKLKQMLAAAAFTVLGAMALNATAKAEGIYVVLMDNPMNFPADAFVGSNWYHLGQLEGEAAAKACEGKSNQIGLVQGDAANASSIYQYNGIKDALSKHPEMKIVA